MNKDYVRAYLDKFKNSHKGLENLNISVRSDYKDAFPQLPEEEISKFNFKGGYYPASNTVLIIANKHKDISDLNKTIKHEVFGHHALNRLSKTDKLALLETIATAPKNSEIGQTRDHLKENGYQHFKDRPLLLAEEVFAHIAEQSYKAIDLYISTPDPKLVQSKNDILDIVDALKNGIHHGVLQQQIFPANDNEQFKIEEQNKVYTIRQTKITEVSKEQLKPQEVSFVSRKEAIIYKVATDNTHNFSVQDKQVLSDNFNEITSQAYKNYPSDIKEVKAFKLKKTLHISQQNTHESQKDSSKASIKEEKIMARNEVTAEKERERPKSKLLDRIEAQNENQSSRELER